MGDVLTAQQINDLAAWVDAAQNKDTDAGQRILDALRSHEALRAEAEKWRVCHVGCKTDRERIEVERDQLREAVESLRAWEGRTFSSPRAAREALHEAALATLEALDAQGGGDE